MASALKSRTRSAYLLLTHNPRIFNSFPHLFHADILYNLPKRSFHCWASPVHSAYKTSCLVPYDMSSTIAWSRTSFSTQIMATAQPVISVEPSNSNPSELDTEESGASHSTLDEQGSQIRENQSFRWQQGNCSEVLRAWGCTDDQISLVFQRMPSLHKSRVHNLQSKLDILRELGFTSSELAKIVICRPRFLRSHISRSFGERIEYLTSLFGSRELLQKAIIRNPSLLTYDLQKDIIRVVDLYYSLGVNKTDLTKMLLARPTLIPRTSLNDEKFEYIRRTGLSKDSKMYKYVVTIIAISRVETIREKIANLGKFGFSEDEVLRLMGYSPFILTLSVDKVQRNMTYVVGTLKLPATHVLSRPFLLFVNLEAVLKPRMLLAGKIDDMGLDPKIDQSSLMRALRMTEKRFIKAFISCHPENVAKELMDYYVDAKDIKRLAQSSKSMRRKGFPF